MAVKAPSSFAKTQSDRRSNSAAPGEAETGTGVARFEWPVAGKLRQASGGRPRSRPATPGNLESKIRPSDER